MIVVYFSAGCIRRVMQQWAGICPFHTVVMVAAAVKVGTSCLA